MFGSMQSGANAYAKIGVETGVAAANPHQLIVMLFDGALTALANALQHMKSGDIPAKGQAISKAITIIESGLRASLNKSVGGEIALNLDSLYEYMNKRLLLANLNNQPEPIEEVRLLLQDIRGAWLAIDPAANASGQEAQEPAAQPKAAAYDSLSPRMSQLVKA